jgi:hypothetical protein
MSALFADVADASSTVFGGEQNYRAASAGWAGLTRRSSAGSRWSWPARQAMWSFGVSATAATPGRPAPD